MDGYNSAMASSPSFTATVSAITDAFGDPTRRSIYLFARDHSDARESGVTASMVASEIGVHANVVEASWQALVDALVYSLEPAAGTAAGQSDEGVGLPA